MRSGGFRIASKAEAEMPSQEKSQSRSPCGYDLGINGALARLPLHQQAKQHGSGPSFFLTVRRMESHGFHWLLVDCKLEYVGPGVMADNVKIEFGTRQIRQIEFGAQ